MGRVGQLPATHKIPAVKLELFRLSLPAGGRVLDLGPQGAEGGECRPERTRRRSRSSGRRMRRRHGARRLYVEAQGMSLLLSSALPPGGGVMPMQ